jgi:hypothetical protein
MDSVLPNYFLGILIWQNRDCISCPQKGVWGMNVGGFRNSFLAGLATNQIQVLVEPDLQNRKKTCLFSAHGFAVFGKGHQKSFLFHAQSHFSMF